MFFLLFAPLLKAQENLILNGDFEEYWECPDYAEQIERCKYVYNPLPYGNLSGFNSSSDYMNSCSAFANVPNTFNGYQHAFHGNGFIGIFNMDNPNFHYREYVQLEFSEELECGSIYTFSGYFNLANPYRYSTKNIGFFFSKEEVEEQDYLYNLYTPQYVDRFTEITDTANWTKISFDFAADKNYRFVNIGHYEKDSTDSYIEIDQNAIVQSFATYLNIDSVSLVKKGTITLNIPNVFTPNGDGVNDVFIIDENKNLFQEMLIFNRWGNQVAKLSDSLVWDGNSNNESVSDGIYFYILTPNEGCKSMKNTNYQGMIHLIR